MLDFVEIWCGMVKYTSDQIKDGGWRTNFEMVKSHFLTQWSLRRFGFETKQSEI